MYGLHSFGGISSVSITSTTAGLRFNMNMEFPGVRICIIARSRPKTPYLSSKESSLLKKIVFISKVGSDPIPPKNRGDDRIKYHCSLIFLLIYK